jgi:hypothetical protein
MIDILELIPSDRPVSRGSVWRKARKSGWNRHSVNQAIRDLISVGKIVAVNAQVRAVAQ